MNNPKEGQATGGAPETSVLKSIVSGDGMKGKIVDTYCNKSTGKINTPGTHKDYK